MGWVTLALKNEACVDSCAFHQQPGWEAKKGRVKEWMRQQLQGEGVLSLH